MRIQTLAFVLLLAACGDNSVQYLVEPSAPASQSGLRVSTMEIRDLVLPSYVEDSAILVQGADGGLTKVKDAVWADATGPALTRTLAASLAARSTAQVAAEPWPLAEPPESRLEVRIENMVAGNDGQFRMTGQYAVASFRIREILARFEVAAPITGEGPAGIAQAKGAALDLLAEDIIKRLR